MKAKYVSLAVVGLVIFSYFFFIKKTDAKKNGARKDDTVIVVGTSADYPPFAAVDYKTGKIVGFDIDVVSEIALRLGKTVEIKDVPFAGLIFSLLSGDVSVVAAGMSPSKKRAQVVAFSDQYMQPDPFVIIVKKSNNLAANSSISLDGLVGKRVSVNSGYTAETYLSEKEGIDLVRLGTPAESIMALKSGAVDAFVCAQSVVNAIFSNRDLLQDLEVAVVPDTGDGCALVVRKDNTKLLDEINVALDAMKRDGTLTGIQAKWNLK